MKNKKGTNLWLRYKINYHLFKRFKCMSLTRVNCEINGNKNNAFYKIISLDISSGTN